MPCFDPTDRDPSPEQLLAAKMPAVLCGLVSKLGDTAILNTVDWSKAGVSKEDFQKWWDLHKEADSVKEEPVRNNYKVYYSNRSIPLLHIDAAYDKPVITLENYTKWYNIFMVMPDGSVKKVDIRDIEIVSDASGMKLWIDHLYHPRLLYLLATHLDAYVDERAVEVAAGRWMIENIADDKNNFHDPALD